MFRSTTRHGAALVIAGAAWLLGAAVAMADAPSVETSTVHVERPFVDCPGFATTGVWEITHRLTIFTDATGVPIRDIEAVTFDGRIVNTATGAWVPDSGARRFFDTLAPDGSFLETTMVEVRKSAYVHTAGRSDFQTGAFHGTDGFGDDGIAALCAALAE